MPKPRRMLNFDVNRVKIRIPWMIEIEGEGIIPVVGALVIGVVVVVWLLLLAVVR